MTDDIIQLIAELLMSELILNGFPTKIKCTLKESILSVAPPQDYTFELQTDGFPCAGKPIRFYSVIMSEHGTIIALGEEFQQTHYVARPPIIRRYKYEIGNPSFKPELLIKRVILWFKQRISKCT